MKNKTISLTTILLFVLMQCLLVSQKNNVWAASYPIEEGTYIIKSALDEGLCLQIQDSSKENGGNVELWEKNGSESQKFVFKKLENGYYSIEALHSKKFIEVVGGALGNGANIDQWENNNGGDNQKWLLKEAEKGYFYLVNKRSNKNIDVVGNETQNGTNINQWEHNGGNNQKFKLEKISSNNTNSESNTTNTNEEEKKSNSSEKIEDGTYTIKSAINTKYSIDIEGVSTLNGANVDLWEYYGGKGQQFIIKNLGNDYFTIQAVCSNQFLEVVGGAKTMGANIDQWPSNGGGDNQKWLIKKEQNGYYYIINKRSNMYLEIAGAKCTNGTNIDQWPSNGGGNNQKWVIEKLPNNTTKSEEKKETIKEETKIDDGYYAIKTAMNSQYGLDIEGGSIYNGGNVLLWKYNGSNNQIFKVQRLSDGSYHIQSCRSKKFLDVVRSSKTIGANVNQWESNGGGDNQKWIIKDAGNNSFNIINKNSGMYLDIEGAKCTNGSNIDQWETNGGGANQKFIFEKYDVSQHDKFYQILEDGVYTIKTLANSQFSLDVTGASTKNDANIELWNYLKQSNQQFKFQYMGNGYYNILSLNTGTKAITIYADSDKPGSNIIQFDQNGGNNQKWGLHRNTDGSYRIISYKNNLHLNVANSTATSGANINVETADYSVYQSFIIEKAYNINIDNNKYPGYRDKIEKLLSENPNWKIEFLYTGLTFDQAVNGEYSIRKRNLVPKSYGAYSAWVADDDKTLYDTGWYPASRKAIAYQMDPRNALTTTGIFQFKDVNKFNGEAVSVSKLNERVSGTILSGYGNDIYNACRNTNVDPYFIIARIIQEGGGSTLKMVRSEGTYYNPFNIGASGDGTANVINNAYNSAKSRGWDTMQKAIEGGIYFLKQNFLESYQNTLYTNKFDIDKRHGGSLYNHQYMQNLFAAQSEANFLKGYYQKEGTLNSNFTFIIPLYENMPSSASPNPTISYSTICNYTAVIKTNDGNGCYVRSGPGTSYSSLGAFIDGTVLNVIDNVTYRNTNGYDWYKVVLPSGSQGYIPSKFLSY